MKYYVSVYVQCPFYHSEEAQKIHCEGIEGKGTSLHNVFGDRNELRRYKERYCCGNYEKCKLAKMLTSKYDEDEEAHF